MNLHLLHQEDTLDRNAIRCAAVRVLAVLVLFMTVGAARAAVMLGQLDGTEGFAVTGLIPRICAGNDVASVGDVNGDGFDDFIVGQQFLVAATPADNDAAFLIFGNGSAMPPVLNASELDGTNGVMILGTYNIRTGFGISVAGAGDVNGDGYNDFIIGAPRAEKVSSSTPTNIISGQAYLFYGRETWPDTILSSLLFGESGTMIAGVSNDDYTGIKVAGAGDVNGDGYADFIVHRRSVLGTIYNNNTYVIFGSSQLAGSGFSWFELSSINGQNGFVIGGSSFFPATEHSLSVAGAGDLNGDGYDDIVIGGNRGAPFMDSFGYVIFGRGSNFASVVEPTQLTGPNGFRFNVPYFSSLHGLQVASAGDVNGDGYADIIVGPGDSGLTAIPPDKTYVIFGKESWSAAAVTLPDYLNGTTGVTLKGASGQGAWWPYAALAGAGDVNGDGYSDLLIGSWFSGMHQFGGETHLLFGKDAWPATEIVPGALDAEMGQKYFGEQHARAGYSVSGAGDINKDGFMDMLIGAPLSSSNGRAYVVYGSGEINGMATYKSRTATGNSPKSAVGIPGDPGDGTSPSRVWLDFDSGVLRSLETATITRSNAGLSGFARPEEVADVTWQITTTRQHWNNVEVTLKYTDAEIAKLPGAKAQLCIYAAPAPDGPWTKQSTSNDVKRNQMAVSAAFGQLGHYAIGTQTAMQASVDEWSLY